MNKNKVVLYIATSLDGYIARPNGAVDWLDDLEVDGEDNSYYEFYQTIGTVVMGRLTYDEVLKLADNFPYADKPCYVLSRSAHAPAPHVTFTDEDIETLIPRLQQSSDGDVWLIGGGQIVAAFLEKNLLDELQIAIIPKVLGDGIPLFPKGTVPSSFQLTEMKDMRAFISLIYTVNKN